MARASAITDGTSDLGDPGVVAVLLGGELCTGTLVSPWVVVTAAHCIGPAGRMSVRFGADATVADVQRTVTGAIAHPRFDPETYAYDIGVVILGARAPEEARPWPLFEGPLDASFLGGPVRIVGFGYGGASSPEAGVKRQGTAKITAIDATTFRLEKAPSQTCKGDSGGPAFATIAGVERLVGVTSVGDSSCVSYGEQTRVDTFVAFLRPWIERAARQAEPGERCFHAEGCRDAACVFPSDAPRVGYCATACGGGRSCPAGMRCDAGGACAWPTPSPGAVAASCDSTADCDAFTCERRVGDARGACAAACYLNAIACPVGFDCEAAADGEDRWACFAEPSPARAPTSDGGCAAAPGDAGATARSAAWGFGVLLACARRRRPRR